jgi:hypothetical protein
MLTDEARPGHKRALFPSSFSVSISVIEIFRQLTNRAQ